MLLYGARDCSDRLFLVCEFKIFCRRYRRGEESLAASPDMDNRFHYHRHNLGHPLSAADADCPLMTETRAGRSRHFMPWILGAACVVAAIIYFFIDPADARWMPKCMLYVTTGIQCPGCGSQRAIHSLLHADLKAAFRANALTVAAIPYLLLLAFSEIRRERFPVLYRKLHNPKGIIIVAIIILGWGIVRNFIPTL